MNPLMLEWVETMPAVHEFQPRILEYPFPIVNAKKNPDRLINEYSSIRDPYSGTAISSHLFVDVLCKINEAK